MIANPKFIVYTGPMFSGKSSRLIAAIDRFLYQKKTIVVFKPRMDNRYAISQIVTHTNAKLDAFPINTGKDVLEHIVSRRTDFDVIAVDEAFMIEGIADVLVDLFKMGKTVLVASLEMSASCTPFEEITKILPWATHIEKCPSVCVICQNDAFYTQSKFENLESIQVGGADKYEPRCWNCHPNVNKIIT